MLEALRKEVYGQPRCVCARNALLNPGYRDHMSEPNVIARAYAISSLFERCRVRVFDNDLVPGTIGGVWFPENEAPVWSGMDYAEVYGERDFWTNRDHFAPDYVTFLRRGWAVRLTASMRPCAPSTRPCRTRRTAASSCRPPESR